MTHPHEDRIALEVKRNEIESRRRESCGYTWRMLSSFSTSFRIIIRKHIWWLGAARYCGLIRKWKLVERITGNRTWFVRLNGEKGKECFESLVAMREYLDITRSNPETFNLWCEGMSDAECIITRERNDTIIYICLICRFSPSPSFARSFLFPRQNIIEMKQTQLIMRKSSEVT